MNSSAGETGISLSHHMPLLARIVGLLVARYVAVTYASFVLVSVDFNVSNIWCCVGRASHFIRLPVTASSSVHRVFVVIFCGQAAGLSTLLHAQWPDRWSNLITILSRWFTMLLSNELAVLSVDHRIVLASLRCRADHITGAVSQRPSGIKRYGISWSWTSYLLSHMP